MFKRIFVANRGEIALRVIRACRELGIETVAIFSEADRGSHYLDLADEAYCVGTPKAADSYLKIDRVISAAEIGNVQAIHPGYGFLSENAHFNEVCRSCNIDFIGPTPEAMAKLGDKNTARKIARDAKVPVVPGSEGLIGDEKEAVQLAHEIGFPVLIKATAGGGGKGMRVAANDLALKSALQQAAAEAEAAFGNAGIYLERYIERPRHVEVQILADHHGNAVHLFERECSTQRRHQKLIEESPAAHLTPETRQAMCDAAVRLVKTAGYTNAGTVEFIVDQSGNFYFIEVNARIQVEHPVTEMVTGIDLIKVANPRRLRRAAVVYARRCSCSAARRSNAASTRKIRERNFQPCPGKIERLIAPGGFGVRWDSHAYCGYTVSPYYDSMIGKLIVHQPTRAAAIDTMQRALRELRVEGIKTTVPLHREILDHAAFHECRIDTTFVERTFSGLTADSTLRG